ncbi:3-oxoacyl-[acyl-carrier-protein] synthase-3 [Krasilnikovia cinnamomea]|uniref:3-oxoacyl-[acyl-carrier-protein] synthase-3 n=1 Tax=Krasilnikovia cinnamomea TaxID=349313 RepID=A0A4Q7ZSQ4_9ACTN|nr:3-oxoacyl-[acyl-carrier-protein] synthase III C-terminal domain-containing protein [Krasilnikovia cinnamomea]RZU53851.1 3-oxoacyl-[acyl-carrier-protein] synthase-3 [Krasilnikovia cinnamomea]
MTITVSLTDVAGYLPGEPVPAEFFTRCPGADQRLRRSVMFAAPPYRHHVAPGDTNVDLIERAVAPLMRRHGAAEIRRVDVLLVHCQLPDLPFVGAGTEVARRLGLAPRWLLDVSNGGCASFVSMIELAAHLLRTTDARTALVCNAQTVAGQVFTQPAVRRLAQAAVPGDGCGVGYLTTSAAAPLLAVATRHIGEYAGDMTLACDSDRRYFEPGLDPMRIGFTEASIGRVFARGNRLVPEQVAEVCREVGVGPSAIDVLVTNQPNRAFLRNWREALQLPPERHLDTFEECGNLFGAAIPVTLDRGIRSGAVRPGDLVVLAGFAHAGDYAAAAAVRWGG